MSTHTNKHLLEILKLFSNLKDEKMILNLFDLFLTPDEKISLSNRYLIIQNLLEGKKNTAGNF